MSKQSSLYPEILFHFTSKDGLYGLLGDTFRVSYGREEIIGRKSTREFGVPMISFCDLRLSELKNHMNNYGKYGIGLSKKWANGKGLNPVWYVNNNCDFADNFNDALNGIYRHMNTVSDGDIYQMLSNDYMKIIDTYRYIKNYQGNLTRNGKTIKNFRFADEREWRYVPPLTTPDVLPFVPITRIKSKKQKEKYNSHISHLKLHFQPEDIKYLIVEHENDIVELVNHLRVVKNRFSQHDIDRLSSRILTAEQIHNDV
ncbi:MAG: abortive infection system antitoxin AbiGi family protein [Chromatiales bacterium]|jgi:hypothetical protein